MRFGIAMTLILSLAGPVAAQQVADMSASPTVARPMCPRDAGPLVAIDAAHNNFHTREGRFAPFATVLASDGYKVSSLNGPLSSKALNAITVLVIANPLARENLSRWVTPTPAAFTPAEATALKAWVEHGGSLFLIVDHMPFPGAARPIAEVFGFRFDNGHAVLGAGKEPEYFTAVSGALVSSEIAQGSGPDTAVARVQSFGGSSFRAPPGSTPLLHLDERWTIYEPQEAWKMTPQTPHRGATSQDLRGAALQFGKGRVIVISEAAMFTAQLIDGTKIGFNAPTAAGNKQFLLNLMKWLSHGTCASN